MYFKSSSATYNTLSAPPPPPPNNTFLKVDLVCGTTFCIICRQERKKKEMLVLFNNFSVNVITF